MSCRRMTSMRKLLSVVPGHLSFVRCQWLLLVVFMRRRLCLLSGRPRKEPSVATNDRQRTADKGPRTKDERPELDFGGEGQQRDISRALDRHRQQPLVGRAGPGEPARKNLSAFRDELPDQLHVLVVDHVNLLVAKLADLPASEVLLSAAGGACASLSSSRALSRSGFPSCRCHSGSLLACFAGQDTFAPASLREIIPQSSKHAQLPFLTWEYIGSV